ncbi:MAG TPA: phospholipase D-like domain-containing protein [Candidatus Saccharimonadales bacterium]|nr:phospholipase D-like domain-containing protein [Candidatus Saccharimonadales bacterium]
MTATLLTAPEYLQDLIAAINASSRRVAISSLIIDDDTSTHALIAALKSAAQRGVSVEVAIDSFIFTEFGGVLNPFKRTHAHSKAVRVMGQSLIEAGVSFTILDDRPKLNPFSGVTHSKWSIVDDICYAFGGVNLYNNGLASTDYMFKIQDKTLGDELIEQQHKIIKSPHPLYNGFATTHSFGTYFIDSGKPNDSPIYSRALALSEEATSVLYVSQYSPSGPLALAIKQKGVAYFNQPNNVGFLTSLMLHVDSLQSGIRSKYMRKKYLHAKFIIFTLRNGKKVALTGSHNFTYKGVTFGTREIALEAHEPQMIEQLEAFFTAHVS